MTDTWATESVAVVTRPAHVILAEDDVAMRHLLASVLRRDGYEVIVARNSDELVEHLGSLCLQHETPDLIVSDARMPGGLGVLRSLIDTDWTPTPIIVIRTLGARRPKTETDVGPVATFELPSDMARFRARVRIVLGPSDR